MVGQIRLFTALTLAGACLAVPAWAQDGDSSPPQRPLPTLTERLQQFRQDLWGDGAKSSGDSASDGRFGADRKIIGRPRQNMARQQQAQQQQQFQPQQPTVVVQPDDTAAQMPTANPSTIVTPALKPQAARRAQGNGAPRATTPAERSAPSLQQPTPARVAPPKTAEVDKRDNEEDEPEAEEAATPKEPRVATSQSPKKLVHPAEDAPRAHADKPSSGVLFTGHSPALSVEATGPRKMLIGKEAQFVVKMHNAGAPANNVVVSVNIPGYVEVVSAHPSSGTTQIPVAGERAEPLEWRISRLDGKSSESLTLKLIPRKSTPLDLGVQWTFTPEASQTLVEIQEPKLAMNISGPAEILFGQSKIYKLTVSNPGNGDSENVSVTLQPIGSGSEAAPTHRLGTLRAGESKTIDVELTAHQAGALMIRAQAVGDGGLRAEAAEQVLVRRANLQVEAEAPRVKYAGTVGTFHVKLANTGNATAENVQVSAMLPPDAKYVSSTGGGRLDPQQGKVVWTVGTLQPGGQRTFALHCSLHAPGDNRMQFLSTAEGELSAAATSATRVEALADLKLEVRDPQGPIAVGEEAVYEVHVRNRGTKAAEAIDLAVFFSEGLEASSVDGGPHDISRGQVIFKPIATLGAGESVSFRVHTLADKAGTHIFRAEVICSSLQTKLATEETTHFYGDDSPQPSPAVQDAAPNPAGDAPPTEGQPTVAPPEPN